MDFQLTDEQRLIKDTAREFTDRERVKQSRANSRNHDFDVEMVGKVAAQGVSRRRSSRPSTGGAGLDYSSTALIVEEIGRGDSAIRTVISVQTSPLGSGHPQVGHRGAEAQVPAGPAARADRPVDRAAEPLGATLVDHPQPAAYCVAGPQPTVVVTTGALQALDSAQLDAVLAHERAHLAGRHHRLVAMATIARQVLPFLPLMRDADEQVTRLAELHADDTALRSSDPGPLATALVILATPAAPAAGLAAAATDAVGRIHRLLGPAEPPWDRSAATCCARPWPRSYWPRCCWRWPRPQSRWYWDASQSPEPGR